MMYKSAMCEIMQEERQELLKRLVRLTEQGKIDWKCVEYIPLSFLDRDEYNDISANLCQMFTLTADITGLPYTLELSEDITIPDGKGDVSITLSCDMASDFCEIEELVSGGLDTYEDCAPEAIAIVFKDHPALRLSSAIVPHIADAEVVQKAFAWARFVHETGVSKKTLSHPLVKLAKKLFNEQRVLDYHRIVFDTQYREQLLSE